MYDGTGRQCSTYCAAGEYFDSEDYLFLRKDLIDNFLGRQALSLVWVVMGERQHFTGWRSPSSDPNYRQFYRAYLYRRQGPIKTLL